MELGGFREAAGSGFYRHRGGKTLRTPGDGAGHTPADTAERMILRLLNEAVACLRAGLVTNADLPDAGLVCATGFAGCGGGSLRYIRDAGASRPTERISTLQARDGPRFTPDPGWRSLAGQLQVR